MAGEQRQEWRKESEDTVYVELVSQSEGSGAQSCIMICQVLDMSANGLKVIMDKTPPLGAILRLCIQISKTDTRLFLSAEVMWVKDNETDQRIEPTHLEDLTCQVGFSLYECDETDIQVWKNLIADRMSPV